MIWDILFFAFVIPAVLRRSDSPSRSGGKQGVVLFSISTVRCRKQTDGN